VLDRKTMIITRLEELKPQANYKNSFQTLNLSFFQVSVRKIFAWLGNIGYMNLYDGTTESTAIVRSNMLLTSDTIGKTVRYWRKGRWFMS